MTEVAVSKTPEPATDERAATGLQELDGMLEGGFLSGSLVTLTGRPGTGTTIVGGASGCTTLLITEEGTGTLGGFPWTGVEEFVADGVIKFSIVPAGEARVRYIEITKMRGTNHQMGPIPIDIGPRGIRIVHPHVRGNPV